MNFYERYLNNCFYIFEKGFEKIRRLEKGTPEYEDLKKFLLEFQEKVFVKFEYYSKKFYSGILNYTQLPCESEMQEFQKTISMIQAVREIPCGKSFIEQALSNGIIKITQ